MANFLEKTITKVYATVRPLSQNISRGPIFTFCIMFKLIDFSRLNQSQKLLLPEVFKYTKIKVFSSVCTHAFRCLAVWVCVWASQNEPLSSYLLCPLNLLNEYDTACGYGWL